MSWGECFLDPSPDPLDQVTDFPEVRGKVKYSPVV